MFWLKHICFYKCIQRHFFNNWKLCFSEMDHIFRYILALILLQIFVLICFYTTVSNNSITKLNVENILVRKRNQDFSYTKANVYTSLEIPKNENKSNLTISKDKIYQILRNSAITNLTGHSKFQNQHKSSNDFISTVTMQDFKVTHNENIKMRKITNAYRDDSMIKRNSSAFGHKTMTPVCWYYFDQKSFIKAKEELSKKRSFYLFYINVEGDAFNNFSSIESDDLLHWQYVSKEEKFLVQLPVDFDMISFGLLNFDHEQTALSIRLIFNNTCCIENSSDAMLSIRSLLWNDLFNNNTDFYLCNRHYEEERGRFWLYAITTIWIGYDLSCSDIIEDVGIREFPLVKDEFPIIPPIFCYLMSLQFVWIFVLLDIKIVNQESLKTQCVSEPNNQNQHGRQLAKSQRPYDFYKNHDRPYGIKRFIIKLLYYKPLSVPAKQNIFFQYLIRFLFPKPLTRFIFLVWLTILLPFGLYRTCDRYKLGKTTYYDYLDVVLPSEPIVYILGKCFSLSEDTVVCLDKVYAVAFPLSLIWFFRKPLKIFKLFQRFCSCHSYTEIEDENASKEDTKFRELFISPCSSFCEIVCCKHCKANISCMWNICLPVYFVLCLFPVIPFCCAGPKRYYCKRCKNKINVHGEETWYIICRRKMLKCVCVCFAFILSYTFCFRPIISTFTFLFRALTYLFCVALPIRVHILQFILIIGSIIAYLLNYFSEIINMNKEILDVICEIKRRKNDTKKNTSNVFDETEVKQLHSNAPSSSEDITNICIEIETVTRGIKKNITAKSKGDIITKTKGISKLKPGNNGKSKEETDNIAPSTVNPETNKITEATEQTEVKLEANRISEDGTVNKSLNAVTPETNGISEEKTENIEQADSEVETADELAGSSCKSLTQNERTYLETEQVEYVSEEMFDTIYEKLSFVKEKLYFLFFKSLFVIIYFVITVFTFILYKKAIEAPNFRDVFSIVLLIIGPYAISIFMKANEKSYLNEENISEITEAFKSSVSDLTNRNLRGDTLSQLKTPQSSSTAKEAERSLPRDASQLNASQSSPTASESTPLHKNLPQDIEMGEIKYGATNT